MLRSATGPLTRIREEDGIALVMALLVMMVLTISLAGVIILTSSSSRDASRVNAGSKAYALAESGVNDAISILEANFPAQWPGTTVQCLLHPQTVAAGWPGGSDSAIYGAYACTPSTPYVLTPDPSHPSETVSFWGVPRRITGLYDAWVVQATGSAPNPTGPNASPVTRTVTAKIPLSFLPNQSGGDGVLQWVYSGVSTIFQNSVDVNSPLYVNGDITFQNTASIHTKLYVAGNVTFSQAGTLDGTKCVVGAVPGCLNVGGNLDLQKNGSNAGTSAAPLPDAHIVGWCQYKLTALQSPCGTASASAPVPWTSAQIFATTHDNTLQPRPFLPMTTSGVPANCADTANYSCINYASWYYAASPGPTLPCTNAGGLPSSTFDNDTTMNNSITTSFNLTPATAYSCTTPAGGQLSWNPSGGSNGDGQLTVNGTVFIDGSAYINQIANRVYSYTGVGSIMLSGSFSMQGGNMCAVLTANGKACDLTTTSNWDPKQVALAIIANGNGYAAGPSAANVPVGDSAFVKSSQFQGILAGTNTMNMDTTAQVQGPIMSVFGQVTPSQSLNLTFPPIPFAPVSSPGQPPPSAKLLAPVDFAGG
jgi:hypothetical protein